MPLRPQLQPIADQLAEQRKQAETMLHRIRPNQLSWQAGGDRWTIAQILDHLNKSSELTIPRFQEALKGAAAAEDEREQSVKFRLMDKVFLRMVGPNAPVKIPVPPIFEPDKSPNAPKVVKQFFSLHDDFGRMIQRADNYRLKDLRVTSPVTTKLQVGFIAYLQGFTAHEGYHLGQIKALQADPDYPK